VWGNYGYTTDNHAFQNEAPEDPRTTIDCIFLLRFFVFLTHTVRIHRESSGMYDNHGCIIKRPGIFFKSSDCTVWRVVRRAVASSAKLCEACVAAGNEQVAKMHKFRHIFSTNRTRIRAEFHRVNFCRRSCSTVRLFFGLFSLQQMLLALFLSRYLVIFIQTGAEYCESQNNSAGFWRISAFLIVW